MADFDAVRAYLDARQHLLQAKSAADAVVAEIRQAALLLTNWQNVRVGNGTATFPADDQLDRVIDARTWPTADDLAQTLVRWHEAKRETEGAWGRVVQRDREGLRPPV